MKGQRKQTKRIRRVSRGPVQGLLTTPGFFPARMRGKMLYDFNQVISVSASTNTVQVFRANSVHDPDFSGAGTTAAAYTQAAALYQRFRVVAVRAIIRSHNTSTVPVLFNVSANMLNTIGTSTTVALAQRYTFSKDLGSVNGVGTLSHTVAFPMHKIAGVPKSQVLIDDDWTGITSSPVPNNQVFLHVGYSNPTGTATSVVLQVRLEYDVIWTFPVNTAY